jgi:hypothetical protein
VGAELIPEIAFVERELVFGQEDNEFGFEIGGDWRRVRFRTRVSPCSNGGRIRFEGIFVASKRPNTQTGCLRYIPRFQSHPLALDRLKVAKARFMVAHLSQV